MKKKSEGRQNPEKPNILYILCDQLRYDAIRGHGNTIVETPNIDRLIERGVSFSNAYSSCPVCVPARNILRTGCEPFTSGSYDNDGPQPPIGPGDTTEDRCGPYLARVLSSRGYRTFGIGKFHSKPDQYEDLGYEVHVHTEEIWETPEERERDGYRSFLRDNHPHFDYLEQLHGERTNMYYVPQTSAVPADLTVESFVARRTVDQINSDDSRPYFGLVSFIGPHPPCAPPIPYNRMYDPDIMPDSVQGDLETDHMDEHLPWMNYLIWAEDINNSATRNLKSRYYGEITYIDSCIGEILDAVEARPDADNTLICFTSDHGDHLGDHHSWQKESFFEASCKIPLIVSWPDRIPGGKARSDLVSLIDIFALAMECSGSPEPREGHNLLSVLSGAENARDYLFGYYGVPGTMAFKAMVRHERWKYIYMSNGGREQLFDLQKDPDELVNLAGANLEVVSQLKDVLTKQLIDMGVSAAIDSDSRALVAYEYTERAKVRVHQFEMAKGITDFKYSSGNFIVST